MVVKNFIMKLASSAVVMLIILALVLTYLFFEKSLTEETIKITVINKEKFVGQEGRYLIFTPNEVFENSDNFFYGKTNSDLLFNKLERGVTYRVKVAGLYIPFLNRLRNITEVIGVEVNAAVNK